MRVLNSHICLVCHLELLHAGRRNDRGPAPAVRWQHGRRGAPSMTVSATRERTLAA